MKHEAKQTIFVNGIIHNDKQEVLLVQRASTDTFLPGYFELPGGRVDLGETLEHALKRKLQQEINIDATSALFFQSIAQVDRRGPYIRVFFEVANQAAARVILTKAHDSFIWVGKQNLHDKTIASDARKTLELYLGQSEKIDVEKTTYTLFTDGGSRGNPGPSASAYVIYDAKGTILESGGEYIGVTTNNQAEYTAALLGLQAIEKIAQPSDSIMINMDSLLVVNQMNGLYKLKNRELWTAHQKIRELMKRYVKVQFKHVPRENNLAADAKVNEILDSHSAP